MSNIKRNGGIILTEIKTKSKLTFHEGDCFVVNKTSELKDRLFLKIVHIEQTNTLTMYKCTRITNREMTVTEYDAEKLNWVIEYWHYEPCTNAEVEEGLNNFFKNSIGPVRFHFAK